MELQVDDELVILDKWLTSPILIFPLAIAGVERQERECFSITNIRGRDLPLAALFLLVVYNLVVL